MQIICTSLQTDDLAGTSPHTRAHARTHNLFQQQFSGTGKSRCGNCALDLLHLITDPNNSLRTTHYFHMLCNILILHHVSKKAMTPWFLKNNSVKKWTNFRNFGTQNPEETSHQTVINVSTSPVKCSHYTLWKADTVYLIEAICVKTHWLTLDATDFLL